MSEGIVLPTHFRFKNLTGQRFGRLTVTAFAGVKNTKTRWHCACECGTEVEVVAASLIKGVTRSCGCLHQEIRRGLLATHRMSKHPDYIVWKSIKSRCTNPSAASWPNYGGRGISMCDSWMESFALFIEEMGDRPSPAHSIERIDNNGNYEPGNCRWATKKEQANNTRRNHFITIDGETRCITDWARLVGLCVASILERLAKGWTERDAVMLKAGEKPEPPK